MGNSPSVRLRKTLQKGKITPIAALSIEEFISVVEMNELSEDVSSPCTASWVTYFWHFISFFLL